MKQGRTHKIQVMINDVQLEFLTKFAAERCMTKAEALRTILDMRRRQEEIDKEVSKSAVD